jgi:hypothetical protein
VRLVAALQVRWRCAVVVVDGRDRPGEAVMSIASKLKLPLLEMRLFAGLSSPSRARSFAAWIVVPRDGRRNPQAPRGHPRRVDGPPGGVAAQAASRSKARTAS